MDEYQYQIDLLKALNQKVSGECEKYVALIDASGDAFLYYSYGEDICFATGNWEQFFDIQIKSFHDVSKLFSYVKEEDAEKLREVLYIGKDGDSPSSATCEFCKKDAEQWIQCDSHVMKDNAGKPEKKLLYFRDISKFRKQNNDLAYMAYYDSLTGLYNRNRFLQEIEQWIDKASRDKAIFGVAFINLNDFRKINSGSGVLVGDELLRQFGQVLLKLCVDKTMICAHMNGDAFCIAIYDPYGERTIDHVYHKLVERLNNPFILADSQVSVTVSVGVAEYPEAAQTASELIERAEIVMLREKREGQNGIRYFDAPVIYDYIQNAVIEHKLNDAVFEKEFLLFYQPQYDTEERFRGVEALIRWQDEDGRMVNPGDFIPIAEKSSLIVSIGKWVLEKAISTLAGWKQKFGVSLVMAVNISSVHFSQDDFVPHLMELIRKYEVEPEEIELEIAESVLADDFERVVRKLELLQHYGVQTAVDNFGVGYLSFSRLGKLPVHTVKIDKSLIGGMLKEEAGGIVVESMIAMLGRLGYETMAEGVEHQNQLDRLKKIGCEYVQGYLLGRPAPEDAMEILLDKQIWE